MLKMKCYWNSEIKYYIGFIWEHIFSESKEMKTTICIESPKCCCVICWSEVLCFHNTVNLNLAMSGLLAISFLNHWLGRYDDQLIIARRSYYRPLQHKISHKMRVGQVRLLAGKRLRSMARFIYFTIEVRIEKCASFSVH